MSNIKFSLVVFVILLIIIGIAINNNISYKCVEGNCLMTNNGDYSSKSECQKSCNKPVESISQASKSVGKKVQFNEANSTENIISDTSYICDNNQMCVEVPGKSTGPFTTPEACLSNCKQNYPSTYGYPQTYYYPQSLSYHHRRRPYYRGSGRNHRRRYRRDENFDEDFDEDF